MNEALPREEKHIVIQPTEDVLDALKVAHEEYRERVSTPEERKEAYEAMHDALEHFENGEMVRLYDEGKVPTFQSLERAALLARETLIPIDDPEAQALAKLLSESVTPIKRWSRRYVQSILKFKTSNLAMLRGGGQDEREMFQKADEDRRRIHESLLQALTTFNQHIKKSTEFAEFEIPLAWLPNNPLPKNAAWDGAVVFSSEALADRDLIRDWSIVADSEEVMKTVTGYPPFPKE